MPPARQDRQRSPTRSVLTIPSNEDDTGATSRREPAIVHWAAGVVAATSFAGCTARVLGAYRPHAPPHHPQLGCGPQKGGFRHVRHDIRQPLYRS